MVVIKLKKPKKGEDGHLFVEQHPDNFISERPGTQGMYCRYVGKNNAAFEVLPRIENIRIALSRLGIWAKYNAFTRFIEIGGKVSPLPEGALDDAHLSFLRHKIESRFGLKQREGDLYSSLKAIARDNQYDPLSEYFLSLEWDGEERAEQIWIGFANAEDTPLNRAYGERFLTGIAARALFPGIKMDEVITLIGDQGCGKSNLARSLAPISEGTFTDQVIIGSDAKKILEQTRGKSLCEHAEDFRGKYAEEQRKHCLSTTHDRAREAYGKTAVEVPRRFLFVVTTNNDNPVQDPTGARREWIIPTTGQFTPLSHEIRNHLYAEIMETKIRPILNSGLSEADQRKKVRKLLTLPKELRKDQEAIAHMSRAIPDMYVMVKLGLMKLHYPEAVSKVDLLEAIALSEGKIDKTRSLDQKIGETMIWVGYSSIRKKINNKLHRYYVWEKPGDPSSAFDGAIEQLQYS
ncbi:VapE family protein [Alisedimentitalea sp. MJ-SS2]|uniref:VapE domain-containing protein n=1 Tax=Aliisedimentitalea sp. MJ-SS2 TaxID=3049795 RepID=UPI0029139A7E|nr:VapE domain-containing protein [Alisedimentitalea sp. MJ-SS2]MDU8927669.1 VapE family protein [Alisedimentitalea sp. MJ-SS2]